MQEGIKRCGSKKRRDPATKEKTGVARPEAGRGIGADDGQ